MRRTLIFLLVGAFALLSLPSCEDNVEVVYVPVEQGGEGEEQKNDNQKKEDEQKGEEVEPATITLSPSTLAFDRYASSASAEVTSNYDWDCSYDTANGWFSVTLSGNVLTVSVEANEGEGMRTGTVTITAGDGEENVAEEELTVRQSGTPSETAMVLVYNITSADTSTSLPLYGSVECTIDWGDGSTTGTVTGGQPSHTYAAAGEYEITINGKVTALYSSGISSSSNPLPLTAVKQWGDTGLTDMKYAFYCCSRLTSLPETTGGAFFNVTSFKYAFYGCTGLEGLSAELFGDHTEATDFSYAFYGCTSLTELPKGLFDNCTKAEDFSYAFSTDTGLTLIPAALFGKTEAATSFNSTFEGCSTLKTLSDGLFDGCGNATDFSWAFSECTSLSGIPANLFSNCTSASNLGYVFYDCTGIESIPDGLFDNCAEATNFGYVFYNMSKVSKIPDGLFDNCPLVTRFDCAFYNMPLLTSIPEDIFANCPDATNFSYVFWGATGLTSLPAGLFSGNPKATSFRESFYECTNLTGESPYDMVNGSKVHLYEREGHTDIYVKPTTPYQCFYLCKGLDDFDSMPDDWTVNRY